MEELKVENAFLRTKIEEQRKFMKFFDFELKRALESEMRLKFKWKF